MLNNSDDHVKFEQYSKVHVVSQIMQFISLV